MNKIIFPNPPENKGGGGDIANKNHDDNISLANQEEEDDDNELGLLMDARTTTFRDLKGMIPRGFGHMESVSKKGGINTYEESGQVGNSNSGSTFLEAMKNRNKAKWESLGFDPNSGHGNMKMSITLSNFNPTALMHAYKAKLAADANQAEDNSKIANDSPNENQNTNQSSELHRDLSDIKSVVPAQVLQSYSMCIKPDKKIKKVHSFTDTDNMFDPKSSDEEEEEKPNKMPFTLNTEALLAPVQFEPEENVVTTQWSQILKNSGNEIKDEKPGLDARQMTTQNLLTNFPNNDSNQTESNHDEYEYEMVEEEEEEDSNEANDQNSNTNQQADTKSNQNEVSESKSLQNNKVHSKSHASAIENEDLKSKSIQNNKSHSKSQSESFENEDSESKSIQNNKSHSKSQSESFEIEDSESKSIQNNKSHSDSQSNSFENEDIDEDNLHSPFENTSIPNSKKSVNNQTPQVTNGYDYSPYDDPNFDYETASKDVPPELIKLIKFPKTGIVFRAVCGESMIDYPKGIVQCVISDLKAIQSKCVSRNMIYETSYVNNCVESIREEMASISPYAQQQILKSKQAKLNESKQIAEDALDRKNQYWQTQKAIFVSEKELKLQEIELRHEDELKNLEELWQSDKMREQFSKPSAQLISLRQNIQKHLQVKEFEKAAQLANEAEQMDQYETQQAVQRMRQAYNDAIDKLEQKFEAEKQTVIQQYEAKQSSLTSKQGNDVKPLENRLHKYSVMQTNLNTQQQPMNQSRRSYSTQSKSPVQVRTSGAIVRRPLIMAPKMPLHANAKLKLPPLK